eukprot:CAMPEP_0202873726 /NCGR_PEP_ID=MMETSP1391-20130828/23872_1 /ASSEMBLY_ACC=CAM_ASM_000867 /TAXON_ID=1034604 /ORGANISM="Chlamydomonas leiostraca, Strain SAG 11-49" /LENGTH=63 /DNA_ID=CAMNT_0049555005 /DNA_START=116 /DNA_END=304 /DNA_ORIENTATION=-
MDATCRWRGHSPLLDMHYTLRPAGNLSIAMLDHWIYHHSEWLLGGPAHIQLVGPCTGSMCADQ